MTCPHCNRPRRHDGPASTIGSIPPDVILTSRIASACASASRALCYQKMSSARMSRGETLVLVMQPAQDRPTHDLALAPGR